MSLAAAGSRRRCGGCRRKTRASNQRACREHRARRLSIASTRTGHCRRILRVDGPQARAHADLVPPNLGRADSVRCRDLTNRGVDARGDELRGYHGAANGDVEMVHDRMPAVIVSVHAIEWLTTPAGQQLVPATRATLVGTPVSSRANSVANDDPECLSAPAPATAERRRPQQHAARRRRIEG
jgi:hypothetical protein